MRCILDRILQTRSGPWPARQNDSIFSLTAPVLNIMLLTSVWLPAALTWVIATGATATIWLDALHVAAGLNRVLHGEMRRPGADNHDLSDWLRLSASNCIWAKSRCSMCLHTWMLASAKTISKNGWQLGTNTLTRWHSLSTTVGRNNSCRFTTMLTKDMHSWLANFVVSGMLSFTSLRRLSNERGHGNKKNMRLKPLRIQSRCPTTFPRRSKGFAKGICFGRCKCCSGAGFTC